MGVDFVVDYRRIGDGNCFVGGYFWRFFIDALGGTFGIFVVDAYYLYFRNGVRVNLYFVCELDVLCRGRDCDC